MDFEESDEVASSSLLSTITGAASNAINRVSRAFVELHISRESGIGTWKGRLLVMRVHSSPHHWFCLRFQRLSKEVSLELKWETIFQTFTMILI